MGSEIYSEVGPPASDQRFTGVQCECPPVPPRLPASTTLQENLYDIPEGDAESAISHSYTLPVDARGTTCGSLDTLSDVAQLSNSTDGHHRLENTLDSWSGRSSPLLVVQQRPEACTDDILEILPSDVRNGSFLSQHGHTSTKSRDASTAWRESEEESSISGSQSTCSSSTHELVDAFLPPEHCWESPEELDGFVSPQFPSDDRQSRSSSAASAFSEDAHNAVDLRPSNVVHPVCLAVSFPTVHPQTYIHTERNFASSTSPVPSTSSGCTDLSKYSGDYERDPQYMEKVLIELQQRAALSVVSTKDKDSELSSGVECTYSPLSPIPHEKDELEHCYTPLDCHKMEPSTVYARLRYIHHVTESTV